MTDIPTKLPVEDDAGVRYIDEVGGETHNDDGEVIGEWAAHAVEGDNGYLHIDVRIHNQAELATVRHMLKEAGPLVRQIAKVVERPYGG